MLGRLVTDHLDLLDNHSPLPLDFPGINAGVAVHVGENLRHSGQMIGGGRRIEAGTLLCRVGIQITTDSLDLLADSAGAPFLCTLKEQMLQKMGDPADPGRLVTAADGTPDADCNRLGRWHRLGRHTETVGKNRNLRIHWKNLH